MADKIVKITFEIDGLQQSVTNIDDAKSAMAQLEKQVQDVGDAADDAAKEIKKVGQEGQDAGEATEGAMKVADEATGGLATRVKEVTQGLGKMGKLGYESLLKLAGGSKAFALAIASTGIGLLVVALGVIASQWDNILGTVTGVGKEQKQLLADAESTATAEQDALSALEASENSLKLQGKSEREIRDLKIEQTEEAIAALTVALEQQKQVKKSQVEAATRNRDILTGMLQFISLPITAILKAYDYIMGTDYANTVFDSVSELVFDPEEVAAEGDATIAETEKTIAALRNKADGFRLAEQQANTDAANKARELREKEAADKKAADEKAAAEKKAADEKAAAEAQKLLDQYKANRDTINDLLLQADLDSIESTFDRVMAELAIQRDADLQKLRDAGATEDEINRIKQSYSEKAKKLAKDEEDYKKALRTQNIDDALAATSKLLGDTNKLIGEGMAGYKAVAQAQNAIDTYASATAAYKSTVGIPIVGPVLAPIAAAAAIAAGLANAKAIAKIKAPGMDAGGAAPNISVPTGPTFDPTQATRTVEAGNNVVTPTGNGAANGQQVIKAYVISSDVTSQQEADAKIKDLSRL